MAFAGILKKQVLDWLRVREAEGIGSPSDRAIAQRFKLACTDDALRLLTELENDGAIGVRIGNLARVIALIDRDLPPLPPGPPSLAAPEEVQSRRADTCRGRGQRKLVDGSELLPRIEAAAARLNISITALGRRAQDMQLIYTLRKNPMITPTRFNWMDAWLKEHGGEGGEPLAVDALRQAQDEREVDAPLEEPPAGKLRLRAAVIAAQRDDGREFWSFVEHLIALGLAVHIEDVREAA